MTNQPPKRSDKQSFMFQWTYYTKNQKLLHRGHLL